MHFSTQKVVYVHAILTARHLLEVDDVLVRLQRVARRQIGVDVALLQPRVVVAGETGWNLLAVMHTLVQRLELAVQLTASLDVRPVVLGQGLLLLLCHTKTWVLIGMCNMAWDIVMCGYRHEHQCECDYVYAYIWADIKLYV